MKGSGVSSICVDGAMNYLPHYRVTTEPLNVCENLRGYRT